MITPWDYQESLSDKGLEILRKFAIVYYAMEERTGKTITSILTAEKSAAENVLVITKKKAMKDWNTTLANLDIKNNYEVINYHQAHKLQDREFDLVILDESHNYISSFPKPGLIWRQLKPMLSGKPIIYVSATPYAQGLQMLFGQFALSSWSPWSKYKNFYAWFRDFGLPYELKIGGIPIKQYDRCQEHLVKSMVTHLFITKTRAELDFEHEPEDIIHWVELSKTTKNIYNTLVKDEMAELDELLLICDTPSKLRVSLHMLEGGVAKMDEARFVLANTEKVDYILDAFGDTDKTVIMYNYQSELTKLSAVFKNARLLQATSFAEGVDLHMYDNLVIYSQDFSTARHTQRRARQCNKNRTTPIKVHYLLVKGAVSSNVYKTVSVNKKNYVDTVFTKV